MAQPISTLGHWNIGPLQVVLRAHVHGHSGEPAARKCLSQWTGLASEALPLMRDARARPRLQGALAMSDIGWSHSGEALLIGFGHGVQLGMDLEFIQPRPRALDLSARFFHPCEHTWLRTLPPTQCEANFLRMWCAKEAVLKAHGYGIAFGLARLCFGEGPHGLQLLECDPRLGNPGDWSLHQWQAAPGYLAAAAWRARHHLM